MRTLQEKYNGVLEGNFSKTQFRRDAAIEMPQFVSTVNSFDDTVAILKNKGAITEAKAQAPKYSTAKPADTIAPDVLDTGIKFELDKKYGTLDVTPEQYEKAKEAAVKNLAKDVLYYVKQDSIQLDTPGEKMEKAKLSEGKEEAWKEFQKKHNVTDKTIKVASEDFEELWKAGKLKEGFLDRFKKKPAQSEPAPAKVLSADEIQAMIDQEAKTNTVGDILNAATVLGTIDLRNATPEQVKMFVSIARDSDYGHDTITGDNYIDYLESLPNYKGVEEVKVQVNIPGQKPHFAMNGDDMEDTEADEFIARAKAHGATPMNTTFKKVNETVDTDELRARIANILKGQLTSLRKIGGDAIIEDYIETQIQAYLDGDVDIEEPMEVVNDFRYYMDDNSRAAADFNSSLSPNNSTPETLEEDDEESPEEKANKHAGSPMHAPPGLEEDKDKPSFYDYPENKHLDDRDPEEKRKALKEMFKKIIVNLINE